MDSERVDTVVVGGGQAGLAAAYHLERAGVPFVVLEGRPRVGDSWRARWDSLRLFTPARYDGLPGTPYPGDPWAFPTKDELAAYLEAYAHDRDLPVRTGVRVHRLRHDGATFTLETTSGNLEANQVVLAGGYDVLPVLPAAATGLADDVVALHAVDYRRPAQVPDGPVLVVGAGNSGADIALELSAHHRVLLSGRHPGEVPWRVDAYAARPLTRAVFFGFSHVLTLRTPAGRRLRPTALAHGGPLVRVKRRDLRAAGVERVPRTAAVRDGRPVLEDGRTVDVASVIWCTGFRPDDSWVDVPGFRNGAEPPQHRGAVDGVPGLYVVGRRFQESLASSMLHGVGADAAHVVQQLATRRPAAARTHLRAA